MDPQDELSRLEELEAHAERMCRRLGPGRHHDRDAVPWGRYALAMELDDFEFLIDPNLLRGPPRVRVRHGDRSMEVWLDYDELSASARGGFTGLEERRILHLVQEKLEELMDCWFQLREDDRRGRIGRNTFVD